MGVMVAKEYHVARQHIWIDIFINCVTNNQDTFLITISSIFILEKQPQISKSV